MPEDHAMVPTAGNGVVAQTRCSRCTAVLTVSGQEPEIVLEALHGLMRTYGWRCDAQGRRLCPLHVDPPARKDAA
jgi:hypothetical protein